MHHTAACKAVRSAYWSLSHHILAYAHSLLDQLYTGNQVLVINFFMALDMDMATSITALMY